MKYYNKLSEWLKNKFGERVLKICLDGGFTCPNRDGTKGVGGCIFCDERGSGSHLKKIDIKSQVTTYLNSYRAQRANKYIVYFQNFSNTYASPEILKQRYDSALISEKIVAMGIATRPDCINEKIAKTIAKYQKNYFIWVELGLQSSNEKTGSLINKCYNNNDFIQAVRLLNEFKIPIVAHIMIGLPNETKKDLEETVTLLNSLSIWGLKIHSTYVVKDTQLHKMLINGDYKPISLSEYIESACFVLTHISPEIVIHRISGDAPKENLVEPEWNLHKKRIINGIDKYLKENDLYQGKYYKKKRNFTHKIRKIK